MDPTVASAPPPPRLTQLSRGAGCGCKLAPDVLSQLLGQLPPSTHPALVVGRHTHDDAAAYRLPSGELLLHTVDFFSPVVDDPTAYGAIAAANALSDVYAMGGTPLMALALLGWPIEQQPAHLAAQILLGAQQLCQQAGIPLAGGHSVDVAEPVFGLAVTGLVSPEHLRRNHTAQPGDVLILTKALGTGLVTTALKRGLAQPEHVQAAVQSMRLLNTAGMLLGTLPTVHALTDVTGFGLAGHLLEMVGTSLDADIDFAVLPLLPGVAEYLAMDAYSDGTMRNLRAYGSRVTLPTKETCYLACDPQTSGGLLAAVAPEAVSQVLAALQAAEPHLPVAVVGTLAAGSGQVVFRV